MGNNSSSDTQQQQQSQQQLQKSKPHFTLHCNCTSTQQAINSVTGLGIVRLVDDFFKQFFNTQQLELDYCNSSDGTSCNFSGQNAGEYYSNARVWLNIANQDWWTCDSSSTTKRNKSLCLEQQLWHQASAGNLGSSSSSNINFNSTSTTIASSSSPVSSSSSLTMNHSAQALQLIEIRLHYMAAINNLYIKAIASFNNKNKNKNDKKINLTLQQEDFLPLCQHLHNIVNVNHFYYIQTTSSGNDNCSLSVTIVPDNDSSNIYSSNEKPWFYYQQPLGFKIKTNNSVSVHLLGLGPKWSYNNDQREFAVLNETTNMFIQVHGILVVANSSSCIDDTTNNRVYIDMRRGDKYTLTVMIKEHLEEFNKMLKNKTISEGNNSETCPFFTQYLLVEALNNQYNTKLSIAPLNNNHDENENKEDTANLGPLYAVVNRMINNINSCSSNYCNKRDSYSRTLILNSMIQNHHCYSSANLHYYDHHKSTSSTSSLLSSFDSLVSISCNGNTITSINIVAPLVQASSSISTSNSHSLLFAFPLFIIQRFTHRFDRIYASRAPYEYEYTIVNECEVNKYIASVQCEQKELVQKEQNVKKQTAEQLIQQKLTDKIYQLPGTLRLSFRSKTKLTRTELTIGKLLETLNIEYTSCSSTTINTTELESLYIANYSMTSELYDNAEDNEGTDDDAYGNSSINHNIMRQLHIRGEFDPRTSPKYSEFKVKVSYDTGIVALLVKDKPAEDMNKKKVMQLVLMGSRYLKTKKNESVWAFRTAMRVNKSYTNVIIEF